MDDQTKHVRSFLFNMVIMVVVTGWAMLVFLPHLYTHNWLLCVVGLVGIVLMLKNESLRLAAQEGPTSRPQLIPTS